METVMKDRVVPVQLSSHSLLPFNDDIHRRRKENFKECRWNCAHGRLQGFKTKLLYNERKRSVVHKRFE